MTNVCLYFAVAQPPLIPSCLLSLDVELPEDALRKENSSYFLWNYGKAPEVVIEIVTNKTGGEADVKLGKYAQVRIPYYVIYDPLNELEGGVLRSFGLNGGVYQPVDTSYLPLIGLGLTLWHGHYAGVSADWLRWCDRSGQPLLTGAERAIQAELRLNQEQQRAERLAAQLLSLGIEPAV